MKDEDTKEMMPSRILMSPSIRQRKMYRSMSLNDFGTHIGLHFI